jgi:hypothetical protein
MNLRIVATTVGLLSLVLSVAAQTSISTPAPVQVPPLIQFSNVASDEGGNPLTGAVSITFSLYNSQRGGEPLWTETQNDVPLDSAGHYSVQLGISRPDGVPTVLFTTGEARWLGVQIAQQLEQPRVLLLSVPYALKAGDAATIGGLPPSAFVLAAPGIATAQSPTASSESEQTAPSPSAADVTTTGGAANYLPVFNGLTTILDSIVFQTATAPFKIGINTATPATTLDVKGGGTIRGILSLPATGTATATGGKNSQPLNLTASAFNSSTSTALGQTFQWQAEAAANDTSSPSGTLNLLFGSGANKAAETGLNIASNGVISFAAGQTFPGTGTGNGTITGVNPGTDMTGGGTSGSVTLNVDTTRVVTGVVAGTDLTGGGTGGIRTLNLDTTKVPQLAVANTFTANQTVNGNLTTSGTVSGASFQIGTNPFAFGSYTNSSVYLGFAGNSATTATANTGIGWHALLTNTGGSLNTATGESALAANIGGSGNTASGYAALMSNTFGASNTAVGGQSLSENTTGNFNAALGFAAGQTSDGKVLTGSSNTAIGVGTKFGLDSVSNSTVIGSNAEVTVSNAMVLGGIAGVNGVTSSVNVGIGTTAPAYALDVHGTGNFTGAVNFSSSQTFPGVAELASANTFTGNQTINGNLTATLLSSTSSILSVVDTRVDFTGLNTGSYTPAIRFGSGNSGEAISSDRAGTVNTNGIDLYTSFTPRLSVTNTGSVGIGTTAPGATLDVHGTGNFSSTVTASSFNGSAAGLTNIPATYTAFSVPCELGTSGTITGMTNLGTIGTFSKLQNSSGIVIDFSGHVSVQTMTGPAVQFYLEVDGNLALGGQPTGLLFAQNADNSQYFPMHAVFTGLAAGSHSVQIWASPMNNFSATNVLVNGGCFSEQATIQEL